MRKSRSVEPLASHFRRAGRISLILLLASGAIMVSEAAALSVSPSALSYSASTSSPVPASQTITFSKNSIVSKNWTVTGSTSWISVSPSSGTISREKDQVSVTVNASGLAGGTYNGAVNINVGGQLTTIPLSFTVSGGTATPASTSSGTTPTPSIQLNPVALNFSGTAGGAAPLAQTFNISNPTGGTLGWTLTEPAAWLGLNIVSGTTTTEVDGISASVSISGLAAGTYTTAITVSASGASNTPQVIPVTLTLSAPTTAGTAALTWTASTDTSLTNYNVYMGTQSGVYGSPVSVGLVTNYMAANLTSGKTYYFSVTAVNSAGTESQHSNEVYKVIQ